MFHFCTAGQLQCDVGVMWYCQFQNVYRNSNTPPTRLQCQRGVLVRGDFQSFSAIRQAHVVHLEYNDALMTLL